MNDDQLANAWTALDPSPSQRRRMSIRVSSWLDAKESSLASEWLALLKLHPIAVLSATGVAACFVVVATPLRWVAYSVL